MLKDKLEKLDRPEVKLNESFCQTESNSISVLIQTEPIPNKRTREIVTQTDPEDSRIVESPPFHYTKSISSEPNTNTPDQSESIHSSRDAPSHASVPSSSRDSVGGNSVGGQAVGDNPRCQRVINDDEDSDSDKELSPEDLRKLMDEINQSTRKKSPQKIFSPPVRFRFRKTILNQGYTDRASVRKPNWNLSKGESKGPNQNVKMMLDLKIHYLL